MDFLRLSLIAFVGILVYKKALDGWIFPGALAMLAGNPVNIRAAQR